MRFRSAFGTVSPRLLWLCAACCCWFQRPVLSATPPPVETARAALACLTNVAQVRALTTAEAQRGYPVRLRAVVTFHNRGRLCFVQDDTGGLFVQRPVTSPALQLGERVEIEGLTQGGDYAPVLRERTFHRLGQAELPPVKTISFDELGSGKADCQWVEVRGIVRSARSIPGSHVHLELAVGGGRLRAYVYGYPPDACARLVDSTIRLQGAVGSIFNPQKQFVAPLLFVNDPQHLVVEEPAPAQPFAAPTRAATSLLQYVPGAAYGHRVKVRGVVTYQEPGQALFIRDHTQGLRLSTRDTTPVAPGEIVEALGFPVIEQYTPALEDVIFRRVETGPAPLPAKTSIEALLSGRHDADLVTVEARLLDLFQRGSEWILVLQKSNLLFNAHLQPAAHALPFRDLQKGSRLSVTGICLVQEARERSSLLTPRAFGLLLRTEQDVAVLQQPSWWTLSRLLWILGLMAVALVAGLAWVLVLNRRVREQTDIIHHKVQREAVLEERSRIAREIHDSFEQELVAITIQLDTVAAQMKDSPAPLRRQLELTRNLSRHSLAEARRSVWDLRSHLLENSDLVTALGELAGPLAARSQAQIQVQTTGTPCRLSARLENNLLRIAQEALTNALKHGQPRNILLLLEYAAAEVRLNIRDDGCGFNVSSAPGINGGHFGLLDIRERAEKCGGSSTLQSAPGQGTEIRVTVPAAVTGAADSLNRNQGVENHG